MSSDLATIDLHKGLPGTDVSATAAWNESFVKRPKTWVMSRTAQVAGMLIAIAGSPATAVPDFWFFERRLRDTSTAAWMLEAVIGRPVSRIEALEIAARILEQAERERSECAAWEAQRGIQWEAGE